MNNSNMPLGYALEPVINRGAAAMVTSDDEDEQDTPIVMQLEGNNRMTDFNWCTCGRCSVQLLVSQQECICCNEVNIVRPRCINSCVTANPRFTTLCTDFEALETALAGMSALRGNNFNNLIQRPINSR